MMTHEANDPWHRSLKQLLKGIVSFDVPDCDVEYVTQDSRQVKHGTVFLATAGIQRHGLEFAQQAWANGACAVLFEPGKGVVAPLTPPGKISLPVENLGQHAGKIASRFFGRPSASMKICGITGTNGKTTTTYLISTALRFLGQRCGQVGTLGFGLNEPLTLSDLTTPDAVGLQQRLAWILEQRATHVAMEVSSHALDQYRVGAVEFDCAVFTNLSRDHLDYHGDMEAYALTKLRLFEEYPIMQAIINADDVFGRELIARIKDQVPVTVTGEQEHDFVGVDNYLKIRDVTTHTRGLSLKIQGSFGEALIESPLLGRFNAQNIAGALGVMLHWGIPLDQAASSLSSVPSPPGRMESFGREQDRLIVVDYAHTPDALANSVSALQEHCKGKLWCVFGCGGDRDVGKRPEMAQAASKADRVILTNDNPRHEDPQAIVDQTLAGFDPSVEVHVETNREAAIEHAVRSAGADDIVLIAGKGHEDYQIIGSQKISLSDRDIVRRLLKECRDV